MLRPQLQRIESLWQRRAEIAARYAQGLADLAHVALPRPVPGDDTRSAYHSRGVGVAVNYRAIHLLSYYRKRFNFESGSFPIAEDLDVLGRNVDPLVHA